MTHHQAARTTRIALTLLALLASAPTFAATASGTLAVSATVASVCTISNGTLAFGSYDPSAGTALDGSTTLTLTCTVGTAYNIGMGAGGGTGATTTVRKLTNGLSTMSYRLFRDSGRTLNWGNVVGVDSLVGTSSALSLTNTINVYGQIPASEAVPAGSYLDSVAITVTY